MESFEKLDANSIFISWKTQNRTIRISLIGIEKVRKRLKNYGMNYEDFEALIERQDGLCGICHSELDLNSRYSYAIDHDHKTLQIRGLLCHRCNVLLANVTVRYKKNNEVNVIFPKNRQLYQTPAELQELGKLIVAYLNAAKSIPESERRYAKFNAEKIKDRKYQKILEKENAGWDYRSLPILKNGQYTRKKILIPPNLLSVVDTYWEWLFYLELKDPRIVELKRKQREMINYRDELFLKVHPERVNTYLEFSRTPTGNGKYRQSFLNKDFSDIQNLLELLKSNYEWVLTDPEEYLKNVIRRYLNGNSSIDKEIAELKSQVPPST